MIAQDIVRTGDFSMERRESGQVGLSESERRPGRLTGRAWRIGHTADRGKFPVRTIDQRGRA